MDSLYGPLGITTAIALVATAWIIVNRLRAGNESNWPLFYYLGIIVYDYAFPGFLDPTWIYAGVLIALFLRFEFMGGGFLKMVRVLEYAVFVYLLYTLFLNLAS